MDLPDSKFTRFQIQYSFRIAVFWPDYPDMWYISIQQDLLCPDAIEQYVLFMSYCRIDWLACCVLIEMSKNLQAVIKLVNAIKTRSKSSPVIDLSSEVSDSNKKHLILVAAVWPDYVRGWGVGQN